MECVNAIVGLFVNCLTDTIKQKLSYLTSSAEHVQHMKNRMKVLEGHRDFYQKKKERNSGSRREVPPRLEGWLKEVDDVKKIFDNFPSNNLGWLNVIEKCRAGEKAVELTKVIDNLITEISEDIIWSDAQIPLGRVDSKRPASTSTSTSTSTSGGTTHTQTGFKSRDKIFNDALKLLQQDDDENRVIALCGMGGVGKTTLMKQLKEAAEDKKMFNWIVEVVIGKTPNLLAIQKAISAYTGEPLTETETDVTQRAKELSKTFEARSKNKEKILVILDDVWEKIKLEDIGLAPFPNGVKLLLTSRNVEVCRQIAVDVDVDVDSVLEEVEVVVLKEDEARDLFCRIAGISAEHDLDLYQKGCEIVKKCGYLPLAIKIIAATLIRKTDI